MKSLRNIVVLLALILGGTVVTTAGILGGGIAYDRITAPSYEAAVSATYLHAPNHEGCTLMNGAIDLMIKRGYNINKVNVVGYDDDVILPVMYFFDDEGDEIIDNRMAGLWCIGDMKARFGG